MYKEIRKLSKDLEVAPVPEEDTEDNKQPTTVPPYMLYGIPPAAVLSTLLGSFLYDKYFKHR